MAKEKHYQVLMVGGFNLKIGNHIPDNKKQNQKEEDSSKELRNII